MVKNFLIVLIALVLMLMPVSGFAGFYESDGSMKTSQRYTCVKSKVDVQVKASAGVVHSVTFTQDDAAPTAGTIVLFDSLTETGTEILNWTLTTAVFLPTTLILDGTFATGIYLGFTTTADVNVTVCYR